MVSVSDLHSIVVIWVRRDEAAQEQSQNLEVIIIIIIIIIIIS